MFMYVTDSHRHLKHIFSVCQSELKTWFSTIKVVNKLKRNSLTKIKMPYAAKYDIQYCCYNAWHYPIHRSLFDAHFCFCLEETIAVSVGVQWLIIIKLLQYGLIFHMNCYNSCGIQSLMAWVQTSQYSWNFYHRMLASRYLKQISKLWNL